MSLIVMTAVYGSLSRGAREPAASGLNAGSALRRYIANGVAIALHAVLQGRQNCPIKL
jgi:hypothetical protein